MSRSEKEKYLRENFIDAIVACGTGVVDMSEFARRFDDNKIFKEIFIRWSRTGREVFFIKKVGFVNLHVRSEPPGFWGVTKKVIKDFKAVSEHLRTPCWFVLLVGEEYGDDQNGYILEDIFSPSMIQKPSEQAEAFKINERNLDNKEVILSTNKVAQRLIELGKLKYQSTQRVIKRPRKT
jgi:hypothetical protein